MQEAILLTCARRICMCRYTPLFSLPRVLAVSEVPGSRMGRPHTSRDFHLGASIYRQVFQRLFHITNATTHDKTDGESLRITEGPVRLFSGYTGFDTRTFLEAKRNCPSNQNLWRNVHQCNGSVSQKCPTLTHSRPYISVPKAV